MGKVIMVWAIGGAFAATAFLFAIAWSILVHPIQSATALLKTGLGIAGIAYVAAGVMAGNFGNGAIGVFLLGATSLISYLQARRP
ncbi:hypothetical protein GU243_01110 [Pseudarthrobacter psychrotolerans]|uniref:Uncharacterized protein n=1 Tax=Pseudarthrobacter psychrotolerans TaxID=2697569 RepID=A0A6P1NEA9_9MICC|nr:hypothetical protein [Pseudarthrobacter psychrotolerans]QHK18606.1 hypothetical protein GU243_01110 [Pseudarthrobacter psychrotolerans]